MAVVNSLAVCLARVPLIPPIQLAHRTVAAREYCLVRARTTDGAEGIGYCYAMNRAGCLLESSVLELLGPVVLGQDSWRIEGVWEDMYRAGLLLGRSGAVMRAHSAIDIALWDLNARLAGLPLHRYLGSAVDDRVPAYASGGYYIAGASVGDLVDELLAFIDDGFRAVKMRVGRGTDDAARVAAARDAIGRDVELMLDANNAWRDVASALVGAQRFEEAEPAWLEEPFLPDDVESHSRLAAATSIPIATGEIEAGRWRFKQLVDARAASYLQPDATVCGGITEWRRIAAIAVAAGVPVAPHAWHDVHQHLVAATPGARYVEVMPDPNVLGFGALIDQQPQIVDGDLMLPIRPGLGFDFDPAALQTYATRPEVWREVQP